ncbi:SMP-30/gluconolactonase/LRE family protein [Bradyrhizobium hipponense]|uniref:SMP-30/gluconolactonase/LRE family protein n=1 Tax=Bradyrhizobium hipponense TaxID=2605638 RepID=A0A5S4YD26_9BRAD|nr:SMP-30/gluconolactonase/LRE family protein [Bradyrhizobium hipponense]
MTKSTGCPDGMKVDEAGRVFCTGAGSVWVFEPDRKLIWIIETPENCVNVALVGGDLRTLPVDREYFRLHSSREGDRFASPVIQESKELLSPANWRFGCWVLDALRGRRVDEIRLEAGGDACIGTEWVDKPRAHFGRFDHTPEIVLPTDVAGLSCGTDPSCNSVVRASSMSAATIAP